MEQKETTPIPPAAPSAASTAPKTQRYQSRLKYYIHDSVDALRLELTGDLAEGDLGELNGCWRTAKTTLGHRMLLLDLRRLEAVDSGGRQWLNAMSSHESASFLPEHPLHLQSAGQIIPRADAAREPAAKWYRLDKLIGFWRTTRVSAVKSSTPTP